MPDKVAERTQEGTACAFYAGDAVVNSRRGGRIRVVLSPKTVQSTSGFMGDLTLRPGEYVSEHYHPYSEEFLYVVRGELLVRTNGTEEMTVGAGTGVFIPIGVRHRVSNPGEEEAFAVFHLSPLAPRPELGHVDTEEPPGADQGDPEVGAPR